MRMQLQIFLDTLDTYLKYFLLSRPARPSIERVGMLSTDLARPLRPTKKPASSTLLWPPPPPRLPRPPGRPPNWDKKDDQYFPVLATNSIDDNSISTEPEVQNSLKKRIKILAKLSLKGQTDEKLNFNG